LIVFRWSCADATAETSNGDIEPLLSYAHPITIGSVAADADVASITTAETAVASATSAPPFLLGDITPSWCG
jgi:hypothetical protein